MSRKEKIYHLDHDDRAACGAKVGCTGLAHPLTFDALKPKWKCKRCGTIRLKQKVGGFGPQRLAWHLGLPVCSILSGLKTHVSVLGLNERWRLMYHLKCKSVETLVKKMWAMIKGRKREVKCSITSK